MSINELIVTNVRNIQYSKLSFTAQHNLLTGSNGSGKTTILEALFILGVGKSFRPIDKKSIINNTSEELIVTGVVENTLPLYASNTVRVGVTKSLNGKTSAKIAGEPIKRLSELPALFPVMVLEPNSVELLEGGPSIRRQFIDWGVFHVEHRYISQLRLFNDGLKQRNALLKTSGTRYPQFKYWDQQIIPAAHEVLTFRIDYFEQLILEINRLLPLFFDDSQNIKIHLKHGWDNTHDFGDILRDGFEKDKQFGFTRSGPHKMEMVVQYGNYLAKDYLSRGQKKLIVYVLKLAQAALMRRLSGRNLTLLLDDLPSELDTASCEKVCTELLEIGCQTFITSVHTSSLITNIKNILNPKMFHVKHGTCTSDIDIPKGEN